MRTRRDAKIDRQVKQKPPSPAVGKVLRRLFAERDPGLNNDLVATLVIPKATDPEFVFPKRTSRIKAADTLSERPTKRRAAAQSFGAAISRTATSLMRAPRSRERVRGALIVNVP